jgi:hypothetical protein
MSVEKDNSNIIGGALILIAGLIIFGWQIYQYLRYGIWNSVSIITLLAAMKYQWASNPTDWMGLHYVLTIAPLSGTLIIIGLGIISN